MLTFTGMLGRNEVKYKFKIFHLHVPVVLVVLSIMSCNWSTNADRNENREFIFYQAAALTIVGKSLS